MSSARSRAQVPWLLHPESPSHSSSLLPHRSFGSRPNVPRRACAGPTTSRDKDVPTANSGGLRLGISRSRIFLLGQPPTNPPNHQKKQCDETKPTCRKCTNYGVGCSYAPDAPKMQFSLPGASSFEVDFGSLVSPPPVTGLDLPIRLPLARCRSYRDSEYELSSFDRAILDKFENTRVVTFGSQEYSRRYQEVSLQLTRDVRAPSFPVVFLNLRDYITSNRLGTSSVPD